MLSVTNRESSVGARRGVSISFRFVLTFLAVIALDQLTKLLIIHYLPWSPEAPVYALDGKNPPISVIDGFFYIVHITNQGAAWGILSGQTYLLTSIALVTLAALWLFRRQLGFEYPAIQYAMGLFCGGIIGNLIDRICYGHVVDFLDVHLPIINYRWPAFNVADCGIAVGVGLYIIVSFIVEHRQKSEFKSGRKKRDNGIAGE